MYANQSNISLYLLPGRGRRLNEGLGANLIERGCSLIGRELVGEFNTLSFQQQVEVVQSDLTRLNEQNITHLIAISFGAYLFLHSQAAIAPIKAKILLLSPIMGAAINREQMRYYVPPQAERLIKLAEEEEYPKLSDIQIHLGDQDWQSPVEQVKLFTKKLNIPMFPVPNNGHTLDHQYVAKLLDEWL